MSKVKYKNRKYIQWHTMDERPSSLPTHDPFRLVKSLASGDCKARPGDVIIRDPEYFVAGELHYHYKTRERILHVFHKRD